MSKAKRKADEPKPLPKRVFRVIDRIKGGEMLCRGYRPRAIGATDEVLMWWFEPSGPECGPVSARQAVETGQIVPADAGLFGDGNAQSYVAACGDA